jgi:non-ribosomal peptide synthetase component F
MRRAVKAWPTTSALVDGSDGDVPPTRWTLAELHAAAETVAHVLAARKEPVVGVWGTGALPVIGLIAALYARRTFVPFDPTYPRARLALMVADTGLHTMVVAAAEAGAVRTWFTGALIVLAAGAPFPSVSVVVETGISRPTPVSTFPPDIAYVLFTSGSTGRPKAVLGPHAGLVNRLEWMQRTFPQAPATDVGCQKTSPSFVDAITEIFGSLCSGVPLVLFPAQARGDAVLLAKLLMDHGVTRLVAVPSLLGMLLDVLEALPAKERMRIVLTHVVSSGERLTLALCRQFQHILPATTLINLYGSTEVT